MARPGTVSASTDRQLWRSESLQSGDRFRPQYRSRAEHFNADDPSVLIDIEHELSREVICSRDNLPLGTTHLNGRDQPKVRSVDFRVVGAVHDAQRAIRGRRRSAVMAPRRRPFSRLGTQTIALPHGL